MRWLLVAWMAFALGCGGEVPILLYHCVGEGSGSNWDADPEVFRQQMDELVRLGYSTITLSELAASQDGDFTLPERSVVLTFDDGERSVYTNAWPILRDRGLRAELFVVASLIGENAADRRYWVDVSRQAMLVWPELEQMEASGTIIVQSHTMTHPRLGGIPLEQARTEIFESRQLLSERLGRPIEFFAYPFHNRSDEVVSLVEEAGYAGAVAGAHGWYGRFTMNRRNVHRDYGLREFRELLGEE